VASASRRTVSRSALCSVSRSALCSAEPRSTGGCVLRPRPACTRLSLSLPLSLSLSLSLSLCLWGAAASALGAGAQDSVPRAPPCFVSRMVRNGLGCAACVVRPVASLSSYGRASAVSVNASGRLAVSVSPVCGGGGGGRTTRCTGAWSVGGNTRSSANPPPPVQRAVDTYSARGWDAVRHSQLSYQSGGGLPVRSPACS
jgi:hypothetical protein